MRTAALLLVGLITSACGDDGGPADGGRDASFDAGPPECMLDSECAGPPNTQGMCRRGFCVYPCQDGYQECNGDASDGCEVSVQDDPLNCGRCNNECYWGLCADSQCDDPRLVSTGAAHTCALTGSTGEILCWGHNTDGQLGDGTTEDRASPVRIPDLMRMSLLAAGDRHTCAASAEEPVRIYCWGDNSSGQLGGGAGDDALSPVAVPIASTGLGLPRALVAGGAHTCVLFSERLLCWGDNSSGQLGVGTIVPVSGPVEPRLMMGAESVVAGGAHTCATSNADRQVYCWGDNRIGQLGDGTTVRRELPTLVPSLSGVYRVAAGGTHTCAVGSTGLVCWGDNGYGQLGDGTTIARRSPTAVMDMTGVNDLELGAEHTCARDGRSRLYCWGRNDDGRIGDGTTDVHRTPAPVDLLAFTSSYAAGGSHTCASIVWGEVRCWGGNTWGQLGDGSMESHATPTTVPPP